MYRTWLTISAACEHLLSLALASLGGADLPDFFLGIVVVFWSQADMNIASVALLFWSEAHLTIFRLVS